MVGHPISEETKQKLRKPKTSEHRKLISESLKRRWADPLYKAAHSHLVLVEGKVPARFGKEVERKALQTLKWEYDYIERAEAICDFVGVKDGQITLIEVKARNPSLSPEQRTARNLLGSKYRIEVYK